MDTLRIFKYGDANPTLSLSYVSYGINEVTSSSFWWITPFLFGGVSPTSAIPTTGAATYNGIAAGKLLGADRQMYDVTGTSSLAVNFSSSTINLTMNLVAQDAPTNTLGPYTQMSGTGLVGARPPFGSDPAGYFFPDYLAKLQFSGVVRNSAGGSAMFGGNFYGPNREEQGLTFEGGDGVGGYLTGVAVGKR